MIISRQIRAARVLLGWSQERLASEARVALTALKRLESEHLAVRLATRDAVCRALRAHGIVFHASQLGVGVLLVEEGQQGAERTAVVDNL